MENLTALNRDLPSFVSKGLSAAAIAGCLVFVGCSRNDDNTIQGPSPAPDLKTLSNKDRGQGVFRLETFGNEGFWTDAAKLPQGLQSANVTPMQALKLGLSVNAEALDSSTLAAIKNEIAISGTNGPILNDPKTTVMLMNKNAIMGVVVRDSNKDGVLDITHGDKVGISCVMCHGITDRSILDVTSGGSIGKEMDGPAAHNLSVGKILALAQNTRAFYPMAQLKGADGTSIGRAPSDRGLTKNSTEAEFDAYFSDPNFYPTGMFDDTVDGNGNPMHNTPMFRADLSAPFGSAGELEKFEQFANTVYTVLLDPTNLLSPGGRSFLHKAAGAGGDKLAEDYRAVLVATGVVNYPYLEISSTGPFAMPDSLIGIRVDQQKLLDMKSYVESLRSPAGAITDLQAVERGRKIYQGSSCTSCHGVSQAVAVSTKIIEMNVIFPGDNPKVLGLRDAPLSPILDTPGNTFDDKMIVINASLRGLNRGVAMPLLMDLNRKPVFLHDNSVTTMNELFDPSRGASSPHPFYIADSSDRQDLAAYLKSLDDTSDGSEIKALSK